MRKTLGLLMASAIVLFSMGIIVLSSASSEIAARKHHDPNHFVDKQLFWFAVSLVVALIFCYFNYQWWREYPVLTMLFYGAVMLLLILVVMPGIRHRINGSFRWLTICGFTLQPSEFAKVAVVISLSAYLQHIGGKVRSFVKGLVIPSLLIAVPLGLILAEPDYGSLAVVAAAGFVLMFVAGTRIQYLLSAGGILVPVVGAFLCVNDNRMIRLRAWLDGSDSANTAGHQLNMAKEALMNGGAWGKGYMNSIQKHFYTPEAHTDFIFSIGGEEFGFIFSMLVIICFVILMCCGVRIAIKAPDRLGKLLAFGMIFLLVSQAIANIGVVTGLLPTKGLALPLFSYGGTNLFTASIILGTLINIGRHTLEEEMEFRTQPVKNVLTDF